jgi:hypothetical protein
MRDYRSISQVQYVRYIAMLCDYWDERPGASVTHTHVCGVICYFFDISHFTCYGWTHFIQPGLFTCGNLFWRWD